MKKKVLAPRVGDACLAVGEFTFQRGLLTVDRESMKSYTILQVQSRVDCVGDSASLVPRLLHQKTGLVPRLSLNANRQPRVNPEFEPQTIETVSIIYV